nr:NAD(P)H-dependent oxidoreductase [Rickettsiella massiliensis]
MPYVLILYYSRHGAVAKMANAIQVGVDRVKGIESKIRTVPEVSPNCEVVTNNTSLLTPPLITRQEVRDCAALILGSPTRFGNMAAPLKYFIDSLSEFWLSGALEKKPAAVFFIYLEPSWWARKHIADDDVTFASFRNVYHWRTLFRTGIINNNYWWHTLWPNTSGGTG